MEPGPSRTSFTVTQIVSAVTDNVTEKPGRLKAIMKGLVKKASWRDLKREYSKGMHWGHRDKRVLNNR